MTDQPWYDDAAGPLVRAFAVTRGRTHATQFLELVTLVATVTTAAPVPSPEHRQILHLCTSPRSVAEVASGLDLPLGAAKVLISDLIEQGALVFKAPERGDGPVFDRQLIRTVIEGVRRL